MRTEGLTPTVLLPRTDLDLGIALRDANRALTAMRALLISLENVECPNPEETLRALAWISSVKLNLEIKAGMEPYEISTKK